MIADTAEAAPRRRRALALTVAVGVVAAAGWLWSMALLQQRMHTIWGYMVFPGAPGPGKCLGALLIVFHPGLFWMTFLAAGVGWMAGRTVRTGWYGRAMAVLLAAGLWVIPAMEVARLVWPGLPMTFLEPIGLALLTGVVVRGFLRQRLLTAAGPRLARLHIHPAVWFLVVVIAAAALGGWWFWQSHRAYADYQLGYFDFGHFARRVINTWRGVGFLQQTPGLPAFWDHFNPGLAALAPLWGLWPDAHLFFALQATCLALPAVFVYGIARRLGAAPAAAAAWAIGYLAWPVVQQLNYNFSYGWHPVSMALPLMLAGVWCLVSRRGLAALVLAAAACSFKEDVLVITAGLAAGLAVLAWRERARRSRPALAGEGDILPGGTSLPPPAPAFPWLPAPWVSLLVAVGLAVATAIVFGTMDFPRYQATRFTPLGSNIWEIAASPVLRPRAFWGQVLSFESLVYLLILFLPLGLANALRGWPIQIALAIPLGLLLAWHVENAKCIAFQYVTCLIVVIVWAAMIGVRRSALGRAKPAAAMAVAGAGAMATALSMAFVFGTLPCTPATTPFHLYERHRVTWDPHVRRLDRLVVRVNRPDASVLASGRAAAHLLAVRRVEPLSDALDRRELLTREAGEGKTWMDVFEWVLLDRQDMLQLSQETIDAVAADFRLAGYETHYDADDLLLLHRPAR